MKSNWILPCFIAALAVSGCTSTASASTDQTVSVATAKAVTAVETQSLNLDLNLTSIDLDTSSSDFTYYNTDTQSAIQSQIDTDKQSVTGIEDMLAIFNPYGTNTTGLYLYFVDSDTDSVSYTVSTEGYSDFTADANDLGTGDSHEICLIGLVGGENNDITMHLYDSDENELYTVSFSVDAPALQSGYVTQIDKETVSESEELSDGLYFLLGLNTAYNGYSFLVDNDGIVREELVTQGDMVENAIVYNGEMYVTSDLYQISAISPLGKVTAVYDTGIYSMHHDFAINNNGQLIALADDTSSDTVEDVIISVDINSGAVSELIDLGDILPEYKSMTHHFATDATLSVDNGEWDWMHINTIQLVNDDEMILSSRETSSIIKLSNVYTEPTLDYLISNDDQWSNTAYSSYVLSKESDFTSQYGQHTVTYVEDSSLPEGEYYLIMFDNNYFCEDSVDSHFTLADTVNESFYGDTSSNSNFYKYMVNENTGTYDLFDSFPVTYSSIVSSVQYTGNNILVDSGMAKQFSEYDSDGNVIATFSYDSQGVLFCGYRVFKYDFSDYYFAA
ncbi:MAG: aryl-sulfate sulfotransferase [Solobacterium sp.]|jgi:hypothetical protein|nr:aryl-sulfate sulfotransferase [Solobacterium sp.]MCH4221976.1 aryl-sulfate sulfotransferase [Solobacterium sp.]MCH4265581.1 aryl-sulfate sulfotransferase [Solobacterium sp.]